MVIHTQDHWEYRGDGGFAHVSGGGGANGDEPACRGGDGGDARAFGGDTFCYSSSISSTVACGTPGNALALGGDAGKGGGVCPDNVQDNGPAGGTGGIAVASGGSALLDGRARFYADSAEATSGNGGNGGEGRVAGGRHGFASSSAEAVNAKKLKQTKGSDGVDGNVCSSTGTGDAGGGQQGTIDKSCAGVTHHSGYSTVQVCIKTGNVAEGQSTSFMVTKGSNASGGGTVGSDGVDVSCWSFNIASYGSYTGIAAVIKDGLTWLQTNWSIDVGSSPQSCNL